MQMQACLEIIPQDSKRVLVAFSGGLDSSVLLHLLTRQNAAYEIIPWHINHGLLDVASQMEKFCAEQAYRYGLDYFAVDLKTGLSQQLVSLKTADKPKGVDAPSTYIAKEQHKLIQYVAKKHQQANHPASNNGLQTGWMHHSSLRSPD